MFILQAPGGIQNQPSLPIPLEQLSLPGNLGSPPPLPEPAPPDMDAFFSSLKPRGGSQGSNSLSGSDNPQIRQLRTPDEFVLSMHNGNRDIASGENFIQGAQAIGVAGRLPQLASATFRGSCALNIGSRFAPWLAPVSGYLAYTDWRSDYDNAYGTTTITETDENGNQREREIDNSTFDVIEHARANGITLTRDQERIRADQLRSRRGRDYAINTICIGGGAALGLAFALKGTAAGAAIGSFIPIPFVGTAIGAIAGFAIGFCIGAGVGNLVGSAVKGICNFFGGLFSGRARRGGYS